MADTRGRLTSHVTATVQAARMKASVCRTVLARLRASTRLSALVLLMFAVQIGAEAACARQDFIDLGLGIEGSHAIVAKTPAADGPNELTKGTVAHAGVCSHCSCHCAAPTVSYSLLDFALAPHALTGHLSVPPPSAIYRPELRPPIA